MSFKVIYSAMFCALVVGAHSAAIPIDSTDDRGHATYLATVHYGELPDEGGYYEYIQPVAVLEDAERPHERHRRQVSTTISGDNKGNTDYLVRANVPLVGNDKHLLSAGVLAATSSANPAIVTGAGLTYDNAAGHGASLMGQHIPGLGDRLTAAAKLNLIDEGKHHLDANAFHARTFLENNGPTLKTNGANLDYLYNNKVGAALGVSHTDLIKSTTYSGTGKLNVFQSPAKDMSLDLTAGLSKTSSPFMPSTGWQPFTGFSFTKLW